MKSLKLINNEADQFNYSNLDEDTICYLKNKADSIYKVIETSSYKIGKILYDAQQELSKKGYGCFEDWYRSLGFKKTESYQYINHYKFVRSESEQTKVEAFESLPKTLQVEMSKPSANPEVNEAVFKGDITTHKEYKEMERSLKKQLAQRDQQIEELQNQQPKKVEVTKEVVPSDYQSTKEELSKTQRENIYLQEQVRQIQSDLKMSETKYNLLDSSTREARQIESTIKSLKNERNRLTAMIEFDDLLNEIDQFFDEKMAYLRFKPLINQVGSYERLNQTVSVIEHWAEQMRDIVPRHGAKIIEGEIIDE